MEEALALFQLPRHLGITADSEPIQVNIGRFGPYVRYGKSYVSLKNVDPYTVNREQALELIATHQEALANRVLRTFPGSAIQILNGRYGPYITDGNKNVRAPKGREPDSISLDECETLIQNAPEKKKPMARRRVTSPKTTRTKRSSTA